MGDGSRWERWGRWPYQVLGWVLLLLPVGARFVSGPSSVSLAVSVLGLTCAAAGAVLVGGPWWRRISRARDEEIRRNPTGKPVPMEERLASVSYPRARWGLSVVLTLAFAAATVWAIYEAAAQHQSAYIGFAIYLFIPVPVFAWLAWRTRALRRGRPTP